MGVHWNRNPDRKIQSLADLALANESQAQLINLRLLFDGVITPDEYAARMAAAVTPC